MSFKRKLKNVAGALRVAAHHEAAHAVVALAVGVELLDPAVRLTPKPQAGFVPDGADHYQMATLALAGPMSDFFFGLVRADEPRTRQQMLHDLEHTDFKIVMGCAHKAAEVDIGPEVGECNGWAVYKRSPSATDKDRAAVLAWGLAVDIISNRLTSENWGAIKAVAQALLLSPAGLTPAQVRQHAAGLRTMSRSQLHDAIDRLAREGLQHEADLIAGIQRARQRAAAWGVSS